MVVATTLAKGSTLIAANSKWEASSLAVGVVVVPAASATNCCAFSRRRFVTFVCVCAASGSEGYEALGLQRCDCVRYELTSPWGLPRTVSVATCLFTTLLRPTRCHSRHQAGVPVHRSPTYRVVCLLRLRSRRS